MFEMLYTQCHNSFAARKQNHELQLQQSRPLHSLFYCQLTFSHCTCLYTQRCVEQR